MAALQFFHVTLSPSVTRSTTIYQRNSLSTSFPPNRKSNFSTQNRWRRRICSVVAFAGKEDVNESPFVAQLREEMEEDEEEEEEEEEEELNPTPEDLENIREIKRVLELLNKNRDMIFSEVKLTVMIEDPRDVERRRLLGIDDPDTPTREELADALELVNNGKVPKNRAALQMLAEEMVKWPNLEVEVAKKEKGKSLYAKVTDTGVNLKEAAKRLNIDWDTAAEIADGDGSDERSIPSILGFGALYLVSAFPIIIGIAVVLILFYNSLQ